jgi:type I restriction enzyme M protein
MNLYLHGMDLDLSPVSSGTDSLAQDPGGRFSMVLTIPPFGKKSSVSFVTEEGGLEKEDVSYERQDFWTTTKNKQLNFLQHVFTLLDPGRGGRCAIVVPDNVLFEGGAGETFRRRLLKQCDVHTLLRLPTGIWYAPGVKANVLFFDKRSGREEAWTKELWVYDLRTNTHFTLKKNPLRRQHLDEFVKLYNPENRYDRKSTHSEENPEGRWHRYAYEEIMRREGANLDLSWIRDKSLEDSVDLEDPDVIAEEIADDLEAALEQFAAIASGLRREDER